MISLSYINYIFRQFFSKKKYSLWLKPLKLQQYFHLRNSQSKLRLIHQNHYQNRSELWYSSWFSPLEALLVFQFFLHLPCICGKGFVGYGHRAANGCILFNHFTRGYKNLSYSGQINDLLNYYFFNILCHNQFSMVWFFDYIIVPSGKFNNKLK